ncbi:tetratricopeptide repeat protein 33 isoform X2 [Hyalella azteca]|uniref:Tetratricopeptide repeat protein 33 isoform X2 n=1 Tax=Hyalella azteca TaxID=294128 RepID=A0A979FPI2_HYAAZ|nr:tetratricopeptide repeat protein 33 isoform X2 [Hyalella azteca]
MPGQTLHHQLQGLKCDYCLLSSSGHCSCLNTKWWAAIQKWTAALSLQPSDNTLMEMMAQAYMQVGEYVRSIKYAEEAVAAAPLWWCSHQTLGRALLGVGELHRAVLCFSICLRLQPDNSEVRNQDLKWASQLLSAFKELQRTKMQRPQTPPPNTDEAQSIEIIDLKLNPEGFTENDSSSSINILKNVQYPTPKNISVDNRLSLTGTSRFISSCSSNKSGEGDPNTSKGEDTLVDLRSMVCMRPKYPAR